MLPSASPIYLGPFQVQEAFESGGMAVIYRAHHRWSKERAAMKIISPVHLDTDEGKLALRREIQTIAALDHPNIVKIFDIGEVTAKAAQLTNGALPQNAPWFAMEYIDGASLLGAAPLADWLTTRSVLLGLLDALAHAHAAGVIHRDLKPGNVLHYYDGAGNIHVKLVDFGIAQVLSQSAKDLGELTSERQVSGTPRYMAPEQVSGKRREQGPWTDLYAVGCLAWYLMTGKPLYDGGSIIDVMRSHLYTATPKLNATFDVPDGVQQWLEQMLNKRICERFHRAADAAAALINLGEATRSNPIVDMEATQEFDLPSLAFLRPAQPSASHNHPNESTHQMLDAVEAIAQLDREDRAKSFVTSSIAPAPLNTSIPVSWHRIEAPISKPQTGASLGMFGLRTPPFIGRHSERDLLWAQLRQTAAEQKPRVLILEGDSGTGVSRLATWFMRRAHEVGATTHLNTHFDPRRSDLEGLRTMFSNYFGGSGLHGAALTRHLTRVCVDDPILPWPASHLEMLTQFLEPPFHMASEQESLLDEELTESTDTADRPILLSTPKRYQLILDLLIQMAKERVPLLLFDDIQWGPDAIGFAKFLLAEADRQQLPVLILMTLNTKELRQTPSGTILMDQLKRHERCNTLQVPKLSMSEHRAFIDTVVHLHPKLADELAQRTQGAPGFALQIIDEWIEQDALTQVPEGLVLKTQQPAQLPQTQAELQQRRITAFFAALPASKRGNVQLALEIAATLGRHVYSHEWRSSCENQGLTVPPELLGLILERQIGIPHDYGFSFIHPLIQHALLDVAGRAGRAKKHHVSCANMLQHLYADNYPEQLMRLAYHQFESESFEAAEKTYLDAAHYHHRQGHLSQALQSLEFRNQAIKAIDPIASERWCHNQLTMMQLELDLRRLHELRDRLNHLESLAPQIAQGGYSKLRTKYDYIRLRLRLAEGRLERATSNQTDLLEIVRQHPDDEALTTSLRLLAFAHELLGQISQAHQYYEYCQARFTTHANPFGYGFATFGVAKCLVLQGRLQLGQGQLRRAQEIFEREDIRNGIIACTYCETLALRVSGRFSDAARLLATLDDEVSKLDAPQRATHMLYQLVLAIELGSIPHAKQLFDQLQPLEESFEFQEAILHQFCKAVYFAMTQQWERSVSNFSIACTGLRHTGLKTFEVASLCERFASFIRHHQIELARRALVITQQTYTQLDNPALLKAFKQRHPS